MTGDRKILFLDVDGVLNHRGCDARVYYAYFEDDWFAVPRWEGYVFEPEYDGEEDESWITGMIPEKVALICDVVKRTGAEVVLTSSWKKHWSRDDKGSQDAMAIYLDEAFAANGVVVADKVDEVAGPWRRGTAIKAYLAEHPCEKFAVLDDEDFCDYDGELDGHVVYTSGWQETGMSADDAARVEELLS